MLKKIKKTIGELILKRRLKKQNRNREVKNLMLCKSILILASEPEDMSAMNTSEFVQYLNGLGKEVVTIFSPIGKKQINKSYNPEIEIIKKGDLTLFLIPKNLVIHDCINREFDLLIDLSLSNTFTMKYIHALSMAKFKVGGAVNYKNRYSDLTIDIKNNPTVEYLITQLKHYLININKNVA